ncbi:hypothetical protein PROFUN_15282 [Planoprotostelium fungivorum]|uniref:Uncharacterized protein n=1 Tax=Planoprotostelium fungivorum TaxID=1890364 RepID=A0A2P6MXF4_9EUKA|nr:hypothetical protein PROFUN_15282 [Planoprotostelium fungivorum]
MYHKTSILPIALVYAHSYTVGQVTVGMEKRSGCQSCAAFRGRSPPDRCIVDYRGSKTATRGEALRPSDFAFYSERAIDRSDRRKKSQALVFTCTSTSEKSIGQ